MIKIKDPVVKLETEAVELAIENSFESLLFASGDFFASLTGEEHSVELTVSGDVKVVDLINDTVYKGTQIFEDKELMSAIKSGIYENARYVVDMNNWFSVVYYDSDNCSYDAVPFEAIPISKDELIDVLYEYYQMA